MSVLTAFVLFLSLIPACKGSLHEIEKRLSHDIEVTEKQGSDEPNESLQLGTLVDLNHSIYLEFKKASVLQKTSNIKYPVCITTNFPTPLTEQQREAKRQQLERVANRWNAALVGVEDWPVKTVILYTVGSLNAPCNMDSDGDLRVYKVFGDYSRIRGYAAYPDYLNVEGKDEFLSTDWRRNLHEMGHQFGLGDTYSEEGLQTPEHQPPSIMNIFWNVSDLTQDDIDSARHVWARVSGKTTEICPSGYTVGHAQQNIMRNTFCVRKDPLPLYYNTYYQRITNLSDSNGRCLNITGTSHGSIVHLAICDESTSQTWQASQISGQKVHLEATLSGGGRCLAVSPAINGARALEYRVKLAICSASATQLWTALPSTSKGAVKLQNVAYSRCLELIADAGSGEVGAMPCRATNAQLWQFNWRKGHPKIPREGTKNSFQFPSLR
jgi:hypothetical protein